MTPKEYNNQISEFEKTLPEAYDDFQDDEYRETAPYGMDYYTWVECSCPSFQKWKAQEMNKMINTLIKEVVF